jgi:hypothetical protein
MDDPGGESMADDHVPYGDVLRGPGANDGLHR